MVSVHAAASKITWKLVEIYSPVMSKSVMTEMIKKYVPFPVAQPLLILVSVSNTSTLNKAKNFAVQIFYGHNEKSEVDASILTQLGNLVSKLEGTTLVHILFSSAGCTPTGIALHYCYNISKSMLLTLACQKLGKTTYPTIGRIVHVAAAPLVGQNAPPLTSKLADLTLKTSVMVYNALPNRDKTAHDVELTDFRAKKKVVEHGFVLTDEDDLKDEDTPTNTDIEDDLVMVEAQKS